MTRILAIDTRKHHIHDGAFFLLNDTHRTPCLLSEDFITSVIFYDDAVPRLSYESLKRLAERLVSTESQEHVFLPSPFRLVACFYFFIANTLPLMSAKIVIRKASSLSSHTRNSDEQKRIEEFKSLWAEKQINASKTLSTPEVMTGEESTQSVEECHKERSSCEEKQPRECLSMTHERDQHREEAASESTLDSDSLDSKKSDELEAAASERDAASPASERQGKDTNVEIGDFDYRALLDEKRLYVCLLHLAHNTTRQCTLLLTSRTCLPRRLVPGHVVHLKLTARGVCFGEVLPFSPFGPALSSIGRAGEQGALLSTPRGRRRSSPRSRTRSVRSRSSG